MNEIDIVIAGVGRFGALHASVWAQAGARLVGACDPNEERLADVARAHGVAETATELAPLLARLSPSVVVIASDESTHASLALIALEAGCHVFVEKPLALSAADAWTIQEASARVGRHVVTGNISRFAMPYRRMRERLRADAIGRLCALRLRRDFSRSWYASFGDRVHPVWESCIHDIDLAVSFTGAPVTRAMAMSSAAAGAAEPSVISALLEFEGGATATVESAWLVPDTAPDTVSGSLELEGTIAAEAELLGLDGVIRQRLLSDALVEWTTTGSRVPDLSLWPDEDGQVGGALRREVDYALGVVTGQRAHDVIPLDEACWGIAAAEAVELALRTRQPVTVRSLAGG
ncbi:MAG: hypothetical protein GEV07_27680 [Streptosporangiales bacterium]|nr:hypothetical protein [Streptosporangiales bacterium]